MDIETDHKITVFLFFIVFILGSLAVWAAGRSEGYLEAYRVTKAYYEATETMPSEEWIRSSQPYHLSNKDLILDYLEKRNAEE